MKPLFIDRNEYNDEINVLAIDEDETEEVMGQIGNMKQIYAITECKKALDAGLQQVYESEYGELGIDWENVKQVRIDYKTVEDYEQFIQ